MVGVTHPPPFRGSPAHSSGHASRRRDRGDGEENDYHVNFPVEVRFVAADEAMLSPAYGRDVCYVGAYTFGEAFARPFFARFEREMKQLGGRPHWGKRLTLSRKEAKKLYSLYDHFDEVRRKLDPNGTFANAFIQNLFG